MITDLANLGPSLRANPDLGVKAGTQTVSNAPDSGSVENLTFEGALKARMSALDAKRVKDSQSERATPDPKKDMPKRSVSKGKDSFEIEDNPLSSERSVEPETVKDRSARASGEEKTKNSSLREKKSEEEGQKSQVGSLAPREKVMLKFMDSMESEFGIPPARIAEAMANLSDSDLLKAPEETAQQVIAQLGLEPQDQEEAMSLYLGMVGALALLPKAPLPFALKPTDLAQQPFGQTGILSSRERRAMLNDSLEKMNQQFFMRQPIGEPLKETSSLMSDELTPTSEALLQPQFRELAKPGGLALDQNWQPLQSDTFLPSQVEMEPGPEEGLASKIEGLEELSPADRAEFAKKLAALSAAAGAVTESLKSDPGNQKALKLEQMMGPQVDSLKSPQNPQQFFEQGMNDFMSGQNSGQHQMKELGKKNSSDLRTDSLGYEGLMASQRTSSAVKDIQIPQIAPMGAGAMSALTTDGAENKNSNIYQIMNQANYMIKKGGGEAKIQMTPEGLGTVDLRVIVKDGKVDLQMATETKEAKKAIESSIGELKAGLAAHKLSMDSVKVDVGNNSSSDNRNSPDSQQQNSQRHMDGRGGDAQREQARQFLGQFREENFDQRSSFGEVTGLRAYGRSSKKVEPFEASPLSGVAQKRFSGTNKGSGLDLVA